MSSIRRVHDDKMLPLRPLLRAIPKGTSSTSTDEDFIDPIPLTMLETDEVENQLIRKEEYRAKITEMSHRYKHYNITIPPPSSSLKIMKGQYDAWHAVIKRSVTIDTAKIILRFFFAFIEELLKTNGIVIENFAEIQIKGMDQYEGVLCQAVEQAATSYGQMSPVATISLYIGINVLTVLLPKYIPSITPQGLSMVANMFGKLVGGNAPIKELPEIPSPPVALGVAADLFTSPEAKSLMKQLGAFVKR